jgi:hypothetical protein
MPRPSGVAKSKLKSIYSVHPGIRMMQGWIPTLRVKTGKSLEEWLKLIKNEGPASEADRFDWLKSKHGLGTNTASWLARLVDGRNLEEEDPDGYLRAAERYVQAMFAGPKEQLRPIYARLLQLGLAIATDVKACPCKTIVPLYRNHVFAQRKPTARTRVGLRLALGRTKTPKRLINTGGLEKGARITHRIPIETLNDIDRDVERWLRVAYDLDA